MPARQEGRMIRGCTVTLAPLEREHLGLVAAWRNDPEISANFFNTFPLTLSGQEEWYQDLLMREDRKLFIIQDVDGEPIGTAGFDHIDFKNQKAELWSVLVGKKDSWGKGFGTDATRALLGFAFWEMNMNRVCLEVYASNQRAIRMYEACGFRVEGTLRESSYRHGRFQDTVIMSVLRTEHSAASPSGPFCGELQKPRQ